MTLDDRSGIVIIRAEDRLDAERILAGDPAVGATLLAWQAFLRDKGTGGAREDYPLVHAVALCGGAVGQDGEKQRAIAAQSLLDLQAATANSTGEREASPGPPSSWQPKSIHSLVIWLLRKASMIVP